MNTLPAGIKPQPAGKPHVYYEGFSRWCCVYTFPTTSTTVMGFGASAEGAYESFKQCAMNREMPLY